MPRAVSMVRQATSAASAFVGVVAQLIVDQGLNVIRVHDGVTPGGFPQLGAGNNLSDLPNKALARTNIGALAIASNLSDLSSTSTARTNLGCLSITANLGDLNNPATARTNLNLGNAATQSSTDTGSGPLTNLTGSWAIGDIPQMSNAHGTLATSGISYGNVMVKSDNLSGLSNYTTARATLGLGTSAVKDIGTSGANVPLLNANGGTNLYSNSHIFAGVNALRMDGGDASSHPVVYLDGTQTGANAGRIKYSTSGPPTLDDGEIWLVYT